VAVDEESGVRTEPGRQGQIMGYEKNGEIFISIEIGQRLHEPNGGGEVQVFCRFVGDKELWPSHQSPGDQGLLALSA
jgi:hypothetical protein